MCRVNPRTERQAMNTTDKLRDAAQQAERKPLKFPATDDPVAAALFWLDAALRCPGFDWDHDQKECAEGALRSALAQQDAQAVALRSASRLQHILLFLLGEGDLHGYSFGEHKDGQGQYWWRVHLREAMLNAAPTPPAQAVPQEQISDGEFDADKRLMELADKIDYEQNWRLSGIDQRDRLTQEQQDRVTAGVMLRRYADLMAPDSWRLFPPKHLSGGLHCFRAATLEKAVEMASRHIRLNAATAPLEQQGNPNPST